MKFFFFFLLLVVPGVSLAEVSELERRTAEQERQIIQLELQNARLRDEIELLQRKLLAYEKAQGEVEAGVPESAPAPPNQAVPPTPVEPAGGAVHVVRAGESLSKIARQHGTTTEDLAKLNGIRNPALIREGQKLKLPTPAPTGGSRTGEAASGGTVSGTHRVKPGETLYSIARIYGLSVEALKEANPGINPKAMQVGDELKLSARKIEPPAPSESTGPDEAPSSSLDRNSGSGASIRRGGRSSSLSPPLDEAISFGEFARRYRMDPSRLNALNGLTLEPKTLLASGTQLYISAQPME